MGEKGTYGWLAIMNDSLMSLEARGFRKSDDDFHAHNAKTGHDAHWDDERGQWIDTGTGEALSTDPKMPLK